MPAWVQLKAVGSSPLARGTFVQIGANTETERLIPARAGNILSLRRERTSFAAHPRSRGEHLQPPLKLLVPVGSSPLARGT